MKHQYIGGVWDSAITTIAWPQNEGANGLWSSRVAACRLPYLRDALLPCSSYPHPQNGVPFPCPWGRPSAFFPWSLGTGRYQCCYLSNSPHVERNNLQPKEQTEPTLPQKHPSPAAAPGRIPAQHNSLLWELAQSASVFTGS